jgi:hypothetical protein
VKTAYVAPCTEWSGLTTKVNIKSQHLCVQTIDILTVKSNLSWLHLGKPNFQLLFAFECTILACKCLSAAAKYCLAVVDTAFPHCCPSKTSIHLTAIVSAGH